MMKYYKFASVPHLEKVAIPLCHEGKWYVCEESVAYYLDRGTEVRITLIAGESKQFDAWKLCELLNRTLKENPDFFGEHVEEAGGDL